MSTLSYLDLQPDEGNLSCFSIRPGADLNGLPNPPVPFGLDLCAIRVTDAELTKIKSLANLTYLDLCKTAVTDTGLRTEDASRSSWLSLVTTRVTDAGLKELEFLDDLTDLSLGNTAVSDVGLKELKNVKKLATFTSAIPA